MLNNFNNIKTDIKTAATGIIQKSNPKSFFLKFHQGSTFANKIFEENPKNNDKSIEVLQIMLINENCMIVEVVHTENL